MRWTAPADTSAITLSSGAIVSVTDGVATMPDNLGVGDLVSLRGNGFVPEHETAPAAAIAKPEVPVQDPPVTAEPEHDEEHPEA